MGEVTANAEWDVWWTAISGGFGPRIQDYYNRTAWQVTNTFGKGWVAYRVNCAADFTWVQLSYALDDNTSIPLRLEHVTVINRAAVRYDSNLVSLNIVHRF